MLELSFKTLHVSKDRCASPYNPFYLNLIKQQPK